jgi:hypothetical protein
MIEYLLVFLIAIIAYLLSKKKKSNEGFDFRIGSESYIQKHKIPDDIELYSKLNY